MNYNILENYNLDYVPKNIYYNEIFGISKIDKIIKDNVMKSKLIKELTNQQFEDGSWDKFHTLSSDSKTNLTTENAIRRLLILGLTKNDEPLKKAFLYMKRFLDKEIDIRDRKEGFSDWEEITELFAATWMLEIDRNCRIAGKIADKWARLITLSFAKEIFNINDYRKAFVDIFNVNAGKRVWDIESFHIVSILKNRLSPEIEEKFINYILSSNKGIYYVTSRKGRLIDLPDNFMSRRTSRFLYAHILLSKYSAYKKKNAYVVDWLMANKGDDGLWDLGPKVNDHVFLPFSETWRKPINRKIDSTLFIMKYFHNIEKNN